MLLYTVMYICLPKSKSHLSDSDNYILKISLFLSLFKDNLVV